LPKNLLLLATMLFFTNPIMNKYILLFTLLAVSQMHLAAQNHIAATISNFENNKGICRACLFKTAADFKNNKALQCAQAVVTNGKAQVSFTNLPDGNYAIFVFHDSNSNGKMDKNWLGIPNEGYGASGNKLPFAAAPKFEANQFTLARGVTLNLSIKLRNL